MWRNLGELYAAQGKMQETLESLERAAQLHEKLEDSLSLVYDRISLGRSYLVLGEASRSLAALEEALRLLVGTPDWRGRALILLYQAEACLTLNLQEGAMACLTLAKNSSSRIEDTTLRQDIEQRIKLVIAQVGGQQFLEFRKHLAGQAEIIRGQAMSRIAGK